MRSFLFAFALVAQMAIGSLNAQAAPTPPTAQQLEATLNAVPAEAIARIFPEAVETRTVRRPSHLGHPKGQHRVMTTQVVNYDKLALLLALDRENLDQRLQQLEALRNSANGR
jgi:hypothetical protein